MIRIATILKGSTKIHSLEVDGNFTINGSNTEINSDTVQIKDNIVTLNSGETSNKISKGKAGLEFYRGSSPSYQIVYDETDQQLKAGLSNNLKPIATKEYVNTTISDTKTEIIKQMNESDFLNLAPKINYGEDTVKVTTSGLTATIPTMSILLGGYFSKITAAIKVALKANTTNYIYMERDSNDRNKINVSVTQTLTITEGSRQFSRICIAAVTTNTSSVTNTKIYRINTGYNDYIFNS